MCIFPVKITANSKIRPSREQAIRRNLENWNLKLLDAVAARKKQRKSPPKKNEAHSWSVDVATARSLFPLPFRLGVWIYEFGSPGFFLFCFSSKRDFWWEKWCVRDETKQPNELLNILCNYFCQVSLGVYVSSVHSAAVSFPRKCNSKKLLFLKIVTHQLVKVIKLHLTDIKMKLLCSLYSCCLLGFLGKNVNKAAISSQAINHP